MGILPKTGRLVHYAVDLTLVAGFLAGVKKNTGMTPNMSLIPEPTVEKYAWKYLDYGDYVYDTAVNYMKTSSYFVKSFF